MIPSNGGNEECQERRNDPPLEKQMVRDERMSNAGGSSQSFPVKIKPRIIRISLFNVCLSSKKSSISGSYYIYLPPPVMLRLRIFRFPIMAICIRRISVEAPYFDSFLRRHVSWAISWITPRECVRIQLKREGIEDLQVGNK